MLVPLYTYEYLLFEQASHESQVQLIARINAELARRAPDSYEVVREHIWRELKMVIMLVLKVHTGDQSIIVKGSTDG